MVHVIIVVFNSEDLIRSCLNALPDAAGGEPIHVMVVDNASREDVTPLVKESKVEAEVLRLTTNRGYCGGNNFAIERVMRRQPKPEAVLVLNPDVVLPPGSIKKLCAVLTATPDCGAVSPWVTNLDHGPANLKLRSLWGLPQRSRSSFSANSMRVDRLPGCCMLVKTDVFERVGDFDEAYFLYWEEIDFCARARKMGFQLLIDTDTRIHHGDGEREFRRHRVYYMWRNQVHFAFKNYGKVLGLVFLFRGVCVGNVRNVATYAMRRKPALIFSGLAGLWAGLRGETGRGRSRHATPAG